MGLGQEPSCQAKAVCSFLWKSIVHVNTCCIAIPCHSGGATERDLFTSSQLLGAVPVEQLHISKHGSWWCQGSSVPVHVTSCEALLL